MRAYSGMNKIKYISSWSSFFPYESSAIRLNEMASMVGGRDFSINWGPGEDRVLFVYVIRGTGAVEYEGESYALSPGDGFMIDVKPGYVAKSTSEQWEFVWLQMSGSLINSICGNIHHDRGGYVFSAKPEVLHNVDRIHELTASGEWSRDVDIEVACHLYNIMGLLLTPPHRKQRTGLAVQYIHEHYDQELDISTLAQLCMISPYHFIRCFREEQSTTPLAYINLVRLNKAKAMLLNTDLPIATIAMKVGYPDPSYFSRMFKKQTGLQPKEFRNLFFT